MDKTGPITLPGVLVGAVVAFPAGMLYAIFRRAWRDVASYQKSTDNATKNAWKRTADVFVLGFLLLVAVAYALGSDAFSQ
jgi:ABC-type dipeptide/oligopeptide/nickel transport system permease component